MKVVHSWLQEYVGDTLPDPNKVEELLTFHAFEVEEAEEVEGETVIEVKILPDRGSDALSHRGVARELATILGVELAKDPLRETFALPTTEKVAVQVADQQACPRFTLSVISGVEVKESPAWLQKRLRALGQRPINTIVDATNYVMFALGQPMHAYDAEAFSVTDGAWQLGVRFAKSGETISLLAEGGKEEDRTVELTGSELVIVDGVNDTPVGLAGIKGGRFAELTKDTKTILLEAAHFDPVVIRKTARRLGILTDASKRFENQPSVELPGYAQGMIAALITEIAGGELLGIVDERVPAEEALAIPVSVARINSLLGLSLVGDEVRAIIERVGAIVTETAPGEFSVVPPWERTDLTIEANIVEEVGRIYGLSAITSVVPEAVPLAEVNVLLYYSDRIRLALLEKGFSEVITSSFQKKGTLQLLSALASDKSYVRETLLKNITSVLDANIAHGDLLGIPAVRVFEIGTVFYKTETGVGEKVMLTIGARTKGNGYNPKDDAVVEEGVQAVGEALGTTLAWERDKGVAEVNLSEVLSTLPVPSAYAPFEKRPEVTFKRPSAYPAVSRDIALWVDSDEESAVVAETLATAAGPLLARHALFDTFTKEGRTSYAFRLIFQSAEKTLTDTEVNAVMEEVYAAAQKQGWEAR
jgi:phenylalanyl-tRNA synthetase beta chain